jgi:hypothetical protein
MSNRPGYVTLGVSVVVEEGASGEDDAEVALAVERLQHRVDTGE